MIVSGDEPLHPRISRMLQGHVNLDSLKTGLARLENDLEDLNQDSVNHAPKYTFKETEEDEQNQGFGTYERTDE